ncbi:hypothetical protein C5S53_16545 [Methanophagales archaeon]|nr:hypothetical protein C5S53_16545 [Methanophagales archaeon]
MNETDRIKKDVALFEDSIAELETLSLDGNEEKVVDNAKRYYEDTKYYLKKGDFFTAFGCINYAHGLVDGLKSTSNIIQTIKMDKR